MADLAALDCDTIGVCNSPLSSHGCRETEFFALTNAASWLQPYGKFFMVSTRIKSDS